MDSALDMQLDQAPAWLFATLADGTPYRYAAMHVLSHEGSETGQLMGEGCEDSAVLRAHLACIDSCSLHIHSHRRAEGIRESSGWQGRWRAS